MKAIQGIAKGKVQGVCFRYYTRKTARELHITGWVKNQPDGTVAFYAEGDPTAIDQLAAWLSHGPPEAIVDDLNISDQPTLQQLSDFQIV